MAKLIHVKHCRCSVHSLLSKKCSVLQALANSSVALRGAGGGQGEGELGQGGQEVPRGAVVGKAILKCGLDLRLHGQLPLHVPITVRCRAPGDVTRSCLGVHHFFAYASQSGATDVTLLTSTNSTVCTNSTDVLRGLTLDFPALHARVSKSILPPPPSTTHSSRPQYLRPTAAAPSLPPRLHTHPAPHPYFSTRPAHGLPPRPSLITDKGKHQSEQALRILRGGQSGEEYRVPHSEPRVLCGPRGSLEEVRWERQMPTAAANADTHTTLLVTLFYSRPVAASRSFSYIALTGALYTATRHRWLLRHAPPPRDDRGGRRDTRLRSRIQFDACRSGSGSYRREKEREGEVEEKMEEEEKDEEEEEGKEGEGG
ncbi:hypothetical protein O3P69_003857 [Scylla paramamosain]|uniref:Uncharacterized protein n=1 Tax=Scylla paramamosain TaxID=85552 RepID=A0AAW0UF03_SCYPA